MPEIGSLVVKLQAQTAQFSSQMKRAQDDIKRLKGEDTGTAFTKMGHGAGGLRAQLGLLDNTMRHNVPMAMADLIRKFSDSALVMNALPFAATIAGFVMVGEIVAKVVEKFEGLHSGMSALEEENARFTASLADVTRGLHEKFLQSEIEVDNLTGKHLGALHDEIELINEQNLDKLESSFKSLAKIADQTFKQLHDNWVESWFAGDSGSAPMQKAFEQFQTKYRLDLATKGGGAAAKDLSGFAANLQTVVALEKQLRASPLSNPEDFAAAMGAASKPQEYQAYASAKNQLSKMGYGLFGEKEMQSAEQLLQIVEAMQTSAAQVNAESSNHARVAQIRAQTSEVRAQNEEWRKQEETIKGIVRELDEGSKNVADRSGWDKPGIGAVPQAGSVAGIYDALGHKSQTLLSGQGDVILKMKSQLTAWGDAAQAAAQKAAGSFNDTFVGWVNHGGSTYSMLTSLGEGFVDTIVRGELRSLEAHIMVQQAKTAATASASQQDLVISLAAAKKKKLAFAKTSAVSAMSGVPFPQDLFVGALVFAKAMAFERGGKIPGLGAVPIIAHGGETVVTRALTDRVERAESRGGAAGGVHFHYHDHSTHQALDATGMEGVLATHRDLIAREVHSQLRRLNR